MNEIRIYLYICYFMYIVFNYVNKKNYFTKLFNYYTSQIFVTNPQSICLSVLEYSIFQLVQ
jgi:hypothetical protein